MMRFVAFLLFTANAVASGFNVSQGNYGTATFCGFVALAMLLEFHGRAHG